MALDVLRWEPEWDALQTSNLDGTPATFDLVSAQFLHLEAPDLTDLITRLAGIVRSGGTLLLVGHQPDPVRDASAYGHLMFDENQLAGTLDSTQWEIVTAAAQTRESVGPEGDPMILTDAVVRAIRRP